MALRTIRQAAASLPCETKPSLSVVETRNHRVERTIGVGDVPDGAIPDGVGHLFVALKASSQLLSLDSRSLTIDHQWPLAPCRRPDAIAFDREHNRIVLGCNNRVAVAVDAATGRIVASFPIGADVDGISLDADAGLVVSCGDGSVHIARRSGSGYQVNQIVRTPRGAPNSTLDRQSGRVYVPTGALLDSMNGVRGTAKPAAFGVLVLGRQPTDKTGIR